MIQKYVRPNVVVPLAVLLIISCFFFQSDQQISAPEQGVSAPQSPDSYSVYNNGGPNDFFQGSKSYGSLDQIQVNKDVEDAVPGHQQDFLVIGGDNVAREQFLTAAGCYVLGPPNTWDVLIGEIGVVNGKNRVSVSAGLGRNTTINSGTSMVSDAVLFEIWQLNAGAPPTLLERSEQEQVGVFTTIESPPPDANLTWPPGISGGSAPDDMGL